MLTGVPTVTDEELNAHFRAVNIILSWPCKDCGKSYPCPCDLSDNSVCTKTHDRGTISRKKTGRVRNQPRHTTLGGSTVPAV